MDNRHIHCMTFGGFLVISEVCLLPGALRQQHSAYFPSDTVSECVATPVPLVHTSTLRFFLAAAWDPGSNQATSLCGKVFIIFGAQPSGVVVLDRPECYCLVTCKGNGNN